MPRPPDVTQLLRNASEGHREAFDQLLPLVYDELRKIAQSQLRGERAEHTLQATALVHEAYVRMVDLTRVQWRDQAHFFGVASQAIRRVLIDHARARGAQKRMGNRMQLSLDESVAFAPGKTTDLIALDEALTRLAHEHPEKASVVEMRFFGGLTNEQIAAVLAVTTRTVERHWAYARAWLFREVADTPDGAPSA